MSPLMKQAMESKNERRKRLMALPYPEKVRIVEKMRAAAAAMNSAARRHTVQREEPPTYGVEER